MYTIPTLNDLRRQLHLSETDSATDDGLLRSLVEASRLIESLTQRSYCPRLESRLVSLDPEGPRDLFLPADLLELHAVSDDSGPIDTADIRRIPSDPDKPASILQRIDGAPFLIGMSASKALRVDGVWGWHDRWTAAWSDSLDTVRDSTLAAGAATVSVSDTDASDQDGLRPRFQVGQLLRIDDEYLRITALDAADRRLTVLRAVQGTVAAPHARGVKIETFAPAAPIRDLTLRYAELLIKTTGPVDAASSPLLERMRRLTV